VKGKFTNVRSNDMWGYIEPVITEFAAVAPPEPPLSGLHVVDFGSGYGDLVIAALSAGAASATCVDSDYDNLAILSANAGKRDLVGPRLIQCRIDLNSIDVLEDKLNKRYDVGICTSVLPYLNRPASLLEFMSKRCDISIIECQYSGDGPGIKTIANDTDMRTWLSAYWKNVDAIGRTHVVMRDKYRTLWACSSAYIQE
jgi:hypothetical protein